MLGWLAATPSFVAASDFVARAAAAKPGIAAVGTYSALASPRFGFRGSGFFVGDGTLVATCLHVLPPGEEATPSRRLVVQTGQGDRTEIHDAEIVATDRAHDLALLRLASGRQPALPIAADDTAREGMPVLLLGFPIGGVLGFSPVVHRGIVSSLVQSVAPPPTAQRLSPGAIRAAREGAFGLIQLDATAYPGNSGGPLIDADSGLVVGIVNMVLVKGTRESALSQPTGISYAVPVRHLAALLRDRAR